MKKLKHILYNLITTAILLVHMIPIKDVDDSGNPITINT
jgi:hypothetical protein